MAKINPRRGHKYGRGAYIYEHLQLIGTKATVDINLRLITQSSNRGYSISFPFSFLILSSYSCCSSFEKTGAWPRRGGPMDSIGTETEADYIKIPPKGGWG